MNPENESNDLPRCEECSDEFMPDRDDHRYCPDCLEASGEAPIEDVVDYFARRGR